LLREAIVEDGCFLDESVLAKSVDFFAVNVFLTNAGLPSAIAFAFASFAFLNNEALVAFTTGADLEETPLVLFAVVLLVVVLDVKALFLVAVDVVCLVVDAAFVVVRSFVFFCFLILSIGLLTSSFGVGGSFVILGAFPIVPLVTGSTGISAIIKFIRLLDKADIPNKVFECFLLLFSCLFII